MKAAEKVTQVLKKVLKGEKVRSASVAAYPDTVVETIIFHKLHHSMSADKALKSFARLSTEFVDWNEIRVSTIQEIREQLLDEGNSLDTAVFIKDFLEFVHRERLCIDLEHLVDENLSDVRRFLKQIRSIDSSTIDLILHRFKGHPVLPLNPTTEAILVNAGLVKPQDTRDRRAKAIFEMLDARDVLRFHHFLLDLKRELGPIEENTLSGARTSLRSACGNFIKGLKGRRARTKRTSGPRGKRGATRKGRKTSRT